MYAAAVRVIYLLLQAGGIAHILNIAIFLFSYSQEQKGRENMPEPIFLLYSEKTFTEVRVLAGITAFYLLGTFQSTC